jgi:hypothetical protein
MKIPNYSNAYIDEEKIYGYCLNEEHPIGKHKAKIFDNLLNINHTNGSMLIQALKFAAENNNAFFVKETNYGNYYNIDFILENEHRQYTIRSSWIIRRNEDFPRLITCYVI